MLCSYIGCTAATGAEEWGLLPAALAATPEVTNAVDVCLLLLLLLPPPQEVVTLWMASARRPTLPLFTPAMEMRPLRVR